MLKKYSVAHPSQLSINQLRYRMKKLQEGKQVMSLFDKLQRYDQYVGQLKLDRKNPKVLSIFEDTIGVFLEMPLKINQQQQVKIKKQRSEAYSSPYKNKLEDDIQDPQLFSFSKQRKQSQYMNRDAQTEKVEQFSIILKQKLSKLRKGKQQSDKPRYTAPLLSEPNQGKVSQFHVELQSMRTKQNKKQEDSIHDQSKRLVNKLKISNGKALFLILKRQIKERKMQIKIRTSQYIHELNLLKKSLKGLKKWNIESQELVQGFIEKKSTRVKKIFFDQWSQYAARSQQQKMRQEEISLKQSLLPKIIFLKRFISNSFFNVEIQQRQAVKQSSWRRNKELKENERKISILSFVNNLKGMLRRKKHLSLKRVGLQMKRKLKSIKDFHKLALCYIQKLHLKMERSSKEAVYRIYSLRLMNNLKRQFHFQRAYWAHQNEFRRDGEICLDSKFQKIRFLYEIFDCANHFLSRKGFRMIAGLTERQLIGTIQTHPAFQNYYRLVKLKKYFSAIKNQIFSETQQKIKDVKYKICGTRVLKNGLMSWYKSHLRKCIYAQEIKQKQSYMQLLLSSQKKLQFLQVFGKIGSHEKKEHKLGSVVKRLRVVRALMILKTNKVSKQYYRKIILNRKIKQKIRLLESSFLEWKLLYRESLHHRLLQSEMEKIIKRMGIRKLKENIGEYLLVDKIHRKKAQRLRQIVFSNKAESVFSFLRANYHQSRLRKRLADPEVRMLGDTLTGTLKSMKKKYFIRELVEFWFQRKLQNQIFCSIDRQYQIKLKAKIFESLKIIHTIQRAEKDKISQITKRKFMNDKRKIFSRMIDSTILKLTLRRSFSLAKKYWLKIFLNSLLKKILVQQQFSQEEEEDELT